MCRRLLSRRMLVICHSLLELEFTLENADAVASSTSSSINPGQSPQSVAEQMRNEIRVHFYVRSCRWTWRRALSLVLQIIDSTDIDFESIIQGQPGTQNINTVALPDEGELSGGDTLELTLTGLPGAGEVNLSQTLDAGETLLDAAQSLVADIATLTGSEGEPLDLSGEIVTVTTGAPGTGIQRLRDVTLSHTDYVTVWL